MAVSDHSVQDKNETQSLQDLCVRHRAGHFILCFLLFLSPMSVWAYTCAKCGSTHMHVETGGCHQESSSTAPHLIHPTQSSLKWPVWPACLLQISEVLELQTGLQERPPSISVCSRMRTLILTLEQQPLPQQHIFLFLLQPYKEGRI